MNDSDMGGEARAREQRARDREERALAHQREAQRKAEMTTDPTAARTLQEEADLHARAAEIHGEAAELQAKHAREHDA